MRYFISVLGLFALSSLFAVEPDPVQMSFHRLGVRRFVFGSNDIALSELRPSEVVGLSSMHPSFIEGVQPRADSSGNAKVAKGNLVFAGGETSVYVGGVNPYATYEIDVRSLKGDSDVAVEWAALGLRKRVQVAIGGCGVALRLLSEGKVQRQLFFSDKAPIPPFLLRVQLSGMHVSVFATKEGETTCLGQTTEREGFRAFADFRDRKTADSSTFNVHVSVSPGGEASIGGARSFLSAGVGQADIRMITHKNGAPFWQDNRLWFTFNTRSVGANKSPGSVMSLDPSVFDLRFEGVIVYDHGDGLLRNDYSSHIIYDDESKEWIAIAGDFGGVAGREGRGKSGLVVSRSRHDPRRGFSVMGEARQLEGIAGMHEDPCLIFDDEVKKWRLLTCNLDGFHTQLFESDKWDGPFVSIAGPTVEDSTGVLIQKIGDKRYVFSGNAAGPMLVYSYPDLKRLGEMKIDLPAHWPNGPGRGWPNVFPLPQGFAHRYMALMMDRRNFPGVKGPDWSYGALYLFGVHTDDISDRRYEYSSR
jgi:hypothetical protein